MSAYETSILLGFGSMESPISVVTQDGIACASDAIQQVVNSLEGKKHPLVANSNTYASREIPHYYSGRISIQRNLSMILAEMIFLKGVQTRDTVAQILLLSIVNHLGVDPLNQWGFDESKPPP